MNKISELKSLLNGTDTSLVLSFITSDPGVLREKDEAGTSGLLLVAYHSSHEALQKAISLIKDPGFYEAVVCGLTDEVQEQLAEKPELLHNHAPDGFTPIALACYFERIDMVRMMLEKGADPNIGANNISKVNALHAAVARNNYELCKMLIENGANVNAGQMENVTPLHSAAHRGNLQIIQLLVDNGADINLKMDNGDTTMSIAQRDEHQEVLDYLRALRK